jgi:hypothetical protein
MSIYLALHHGRWRHDAGATTEGFCWAKPAITTDWAHRLFAGVSGGRIAPGYPDGSSAGAGVGTS